MISPEKHTIAASFDTSTVGTGPMKWCAASAVGSKVQRRLACGGCSILQGEFTEVLQSSGRFRVIEEVFMVFEFRYVLQIVWRLSQGTKARRRRLQPFDMDSVHRKTPEHRRRGCSISTPEPYKPILRKSMRYCD